MTTGLLRLLVRLLGMVWVIVIGLFGLGLALYCLTTALGLSSARPDHFLHLVVVRRHVGHFLTQLAAPGPTAGLALLCGVAAILLGLLLLRGLLAPPGEHVAVLDDGPEGRLVARRRALATMAMALGEQAPGATAVDMARVRLSRRGRRGRLKLRAATTRTVPEPEVIENVERRLEPITGPFHLRPRVTVHLGGRGSRTQ